MDCAVRGSSCRRIAYVVKDVAASNKDRPRCSGAEDPGKPRSGSHRQICNHQRGRPGLHRHRLSFARFVLRPRRRDQGLQHGPGSDATSAPRSRARCSCRKRTWSACCSIRTSCPSTTRAKKTAAATSSPNTCTARARCRRTAVPTTCCASTTSSRSCSSAPRRCTTRIRAASSTATSSRRTSCSRRIPTCASSTSASRWSRIPRSRASRASPAARRYMSPEQVQSLELTHHSDLYSLGAVMYELLTGIRPFRAGNLVKLLHQIVYATPPPIHTQRKDVPEELEEIVAHGDAEDAGQAPEVGRRFRRRAHARAPAPARAERAHRPAGAVRRAAPAALLPRLLARRDLGGAARQHHGRTTRPARRS